MTDGRPAASFPIVAGEAGGRWRVRVVLGVVALASLGLVSGTSSHARASIRPRAAGDDDDTPQVIYHVAVTTTGVLPGTVNYELASHCGSTTSQLLATVSSPGTVTPTGTSCDPIDSVTIVDDGGATSSSVTTTTEVVNPLLTIVTYVVTFDFAPATDLQMGIDPATGPAGTTVTVQSIDPCPPAPNTSVHVVLHDATSTLAETTIQLGDEGGSWTATMVVPAGTPIESLVADATCSSESSTLSASALATTGSYEPVDFVVTSVITPSQAATPVVAAPATAG